MTRCLFLVNPADLTVHWE